MLCKKYQRKMTKETIKLKIYRAFQSLKTNIHDIVEEEYGKNKDIIVDSELTSSLMAATMDLLHEFYGLEQLSKMVKEMSVIHERIVKIVKEKKNGKSNT